MSSEQSPENEIIARFAPLQAAAMQADVPNEFIIDAAKELSGMLAEIWVGDKEVRSKDQGHRWRYATSSSRTNQRILLQSWSDHYGWDTKFDFARPYTSDWAVKTCRRFIARIPEILETLQGRAREVADAMAVIETLAASLPATRTVPTASAARTTPAAPAARTQGAQMAVAPPPAAPYRSMEAL